MPIGSTLITYASNPYASTSTISGAWMRRRLCCPGDVNAHSSPLALPSLAHHHQLLVAPVVPRILALCQRHLHQELPYTDLNPTGQVLVELLQLSRVRLGAQHAHHVELAEALRHLVGVVRDLLELLAAVVLLSRLCTVVQHRLHNVMCVTMHC